MNYILNSRTKTLHEPADGDASRRAACGALRHVSDDHVRQISGNETHVVESLTRCGRCYLDAGGY